jgi:glucosylceramidase
MNRRILIVGLASTLLLAGCAPTPGLMEVYSTTGSKSDLMTRQSDLLPSAATGNVDVIVDAGRELQELDGFGVAITHSAAYVLLQQDAETRTRILTELFSPEEGAGFSLVRLPIGTSDYAGVTDGEEKHYTYNDLPQGETDSELAGFSLGADHDSIIPVMQEVLAINPEVRVIASPWSAPAWMKTSDSLYSGSLRPEFEPVFADYLTTYVESYAAEGITIDYLTIQNEPALTNTNYPVMEMGEFQQLSIIRTLGPLLEERGFGDTEVLAYDFNYSAEWESYAKGFIDTVLGDPEAAQYTAGVAWHGYDGDGIETFSEGLRYVEENYPGKKSLITEITEGLWNMDFAGNLSYALENIVLGPLNAHSNGALYWNAALFEDGSPVLGGGESSLGVIGVSADGDFQKSSAYYAMAHFSQFIPQRSEGISRVVATESTSPSIFAATVKRPDGRLVIVVTNTSTVFAETVNVVVDGTTFTTEIDAQSVVTFLY